MNNDMLSPNAGQFGGGFMPQQRPSDVNQGNLSGQKTARNFTNNYQSIRCATIRQIRNSVTENLKNQGNSPFLIDGHEVDRIILIGIVEEIQTGNSYRTYIINDTTSKIDIRYFPDSAPLEDVDSSNLERNWVYIIGRFRIGKDEIYINTSRIELIQDPNQIAFHFFKCMREHKYFTEKLNNEQATIEADHDHETNMRMTPPPPSPPMSTNILNNNYRNENRINDRNDRNSVTQDPLFYAFKGLLKGCVLGLDKNEIKNELKHVSERDVENILDALVDRGFVFSDGSYKYRWNDEF